VTVVDAASRATLETIAPITGATVGSTWRPVEPDASPAVYTCQAGGEIFRLSHFQTRRRGDADRALRFSKELDEHGIAAQEVLAVRSDAEMEWVISREVASTPLLEWMLAQRRRGKEGLREIRKMTRRAGRLLAKMHNAGLFHENLQSESLRVRTDRKTPQCVVMNLHQMRRVRWPRRQVRVRNLARSLHACFLRGSQMDRLRFCRAYLEASGQRGSLRGWTWLIELAAERYRRKRVAQCDRRIRGNNRYFAQLSLAGPWRARVMLQQSESPTPQKFTLDGWSELLSDPASLIDLTGAVVVKESPSGRILQRRVTLDGTELDVYIKQPLWSYGWRRWLAPLRRSRSMRGFDRGHALLHRGVGTAVPLAAVESRQAGLLRQSFLISLAVPSPHLSDYMTGHLCETSATQYQLAQHTLWALGRMLWGLHRNGYTHRDLKASNVHLLSRDNEPPEIVLIDLDGLYRPMVLSSYQRYRDLMRLNVTLLQCASVNHSGRLRMLLGYMRHAGCGRINFKPTWRLLEQWSAEKVQQQMDRRQRRQRKARSQNGGAA
jgi:tRNA A-37 threonylcarbamoyl transferase component Bud32